MLTNLRHADRHGGIIGARPDGAEVYLAPGTPDHALALSGAWGAVAAADPADLVPDVSILRLAFLQRAFELGHITLEEFLPACRGEVPPGPIEAEMRRIPEPTQTLYRGAWAGLQDLDRRHPAVELIRVAKGMTQAQMDTVFGIGGA